MNLDWTHALPFGLLMFAGSAFARLRRRQQRGRAERNYPALAERLGLDFEPPRYEAWVGRLRGTYQGFSILVQADERARMVVQFHSNPGLDVRSYDHWKRPPEGHAAFSFQQRRLDQRLPNRYCVDALGERDFRELTAAFAKLMDASEAIVQFSLDAERIEVLFNFGQPAVIPPQEVERLLPLLLGLAREVEAWVAPSRPAP
jgi:hypothetical protein